MPFPGTTGSRLGTDGIRRQKTSTLFCYLLVMLADVAAASAVSANEVLDWNNEFLTITRQTSGNLVAGPPEVAREIAILGGAMSDAVNAATGSTIAYNAYAGGSAANASPEAAAAAAAHAAMTGIFNDAAWQTPISTVTGSGAGTALGGSNATLANNVVLPELRSFLATELSGLGLTDPAACASSASTLCNGYNLGIAAAAAVAAKQAGDGAVAAIQNGLRNNAPAGSGTVPGVYVPPTARPEMFPAWGGVTPTGITPAQLAAAKATVSGPPALNSQAYAGNLLQTECEGSSVAVSGLPANVQAACAAGGYAQETTGQANAALFWNDPGTTFQPPGHWLQIADTAMQARSTTLLRSAQLTTLLGEAENDAGIAAWGTKYQYGLWRPVTAIRACDGSGTGTVGWNSYYAACDPAWSSLIVTPPHPDYLAGHPAFSGAAATVLADFFGTNNIAFSSTSNYYCNAGKPNFDPATNLVASCTQKGVTYYVRNPATGSSDCATIANGVNTNGSPLICPIVETFESFAEAAGGPGGAAFSRVVGGIHTPFSVADALTLGNAIGASVADDAGLPNVVAEPPGIWLAAVPLVLLGGLRRRSAGQARGSPAIGVAAMTRWGATFANRPLALRVPAPGR